MFAEEPIVCSPEDSHRCFMRIEMDFPILENRVLEKVDQPMFFDDKDWRKEFGFD